MLETTKPKNKNIVLQRLIKLEKQMEKMHTILILKHKILIRNLS
jgi:hypothetical protein